MAAIAGQCAGVCGLRGERRQESERVELLQPFFLTFAEPDPTDDAAEYIGIPAQTLIGTTRLQNLLKNISGSDGPLAYRTLYMNYMNWLT
jgi:hypothetical protein